MNKTNFIKRLFTCIIFPPLIFILVYYCKWHHYLVASLVIFAISIAGSYEMSRILFKKDEKPLIPFFIPSALIIAEHLNMMLGKSSLSNMTLAGLMALIFFLEIFAGEKDQPEFKNSITRLAKTTLLIMYPNYLLTFWVKIINYTNYGNLLFIFMLVLIFANDISCYCIGMLFGKKSRGFIKVSPKKSLAGFIGGFIITPLVGYAYTLLFPSVGQFFRSDIVVIILSLLIALCADIGDLVESVLKRSSGVKDSGDVIPGRGGILDSIDSILMSAITFYLFIEDYIYLLA